MQYRNSIAQSVMDMSKNIQKLQLYLASEKEKIQNLSRKQKIRYIAGYYWLWILGIGTALFLTGYVIYRTAFTPKDFWFYGVFANSPVNVGDISACRRDFIDFAGYDTKKKMVEMNAAVWFDPTIKGGTANSYYQAFVAMVESGDLDVVVMSSAGLKGIGSSGRLMDLMDERVIDLFREYEDRIVYCEPYDEDYSASQVPVGIDVSDSLLVTKYNLYENDCVLGIGAYTKRPENVKSFLAFILPEGS